MFARPFYFVYTAAAALPSGASAAVIQPVPETGKIQWVYSYSEGQKLARETGKPLFVVFRCER
jgi:hypothetical protein